MRVGGGVGGVGGGGNEDEGHQGREPAGHGWRSVWVCAVWAWWRVLFYRMLIDRSLLLIPRVFLPCSSLSFVGEGILTSTCAVGGREEGESVWNRRASWLVFMGVNVHCYKTMDWFITRYCMRLK